MERKLINASDETNDVNGDRMVTRSASGRGRRGVSSQVVILQNPPCNEGAAVSRRVTRSQKSVEARINTRSLTAEIGRAPTAVNQTSPMRNEAEQVAPVRKRTPQGQREAHTDKNPGSSLDSLPENPANSQRRGRRRHWSREENIELMRAYYRVTNLERDRTDYLNRLQTEWIKKFPRQRLNKQRLQSQLHSILRRNAITEAERENIKMEILQEQREVESPDRQEAQSPPTQEYTEHMQNEEHILPCEDNQILTTFNRLDIEYQGVPLENRPILKKIKDTKKALDTITVLNTVLLPNLNTSETIQDTCHVVYCAALTVHKMLGIDVTYTVNTLKDRGTKPPWERRLENKINYIRKQIGILHNYLYSETPSRSVKAKAAKLAKIVPTRPRYPTYNQDLAKHLEILKQKIKALGNRIRRYKKRTKRHRQNKEFQNNQKQFYRTLTEQQNKASLPTPQTMKDYWSNIWREDGSHKANAYWIDRERQRYEHVTQMPKMTITPEDIRTAVKKTKNWTAAGVDRIHNFWWKHLTATHTTIARQFQEAVEDPTRLPSFFTNGVTHMIPKKGDTMDPKHFRPITCLPAIYKLFTSNINKQINNHLKHQKIMCWEQNGCKQAARGCKECLVIDSIVTKHAKKKKKNMSLGWIDYKKAFDSVPHSWLLEVLNIYKIDVKLIATLQYLMQTWRTTLKVGSQYTIEDVRVCRGIFQGDSLSPTWFCMALNPLSNILNDSGCSYALDKNNKKQKQQKQQKN